MAIWPGSLIHGAYVFKHPRWEDYEYELRSELKGNSLKWFGNGLSQRQILMKGTTEEYLDQPPVPVEIPFSMLGHSSAGNGVHVEIGVDKAGNDSI